MTASIPPAGEDRRQNLPLRNIFDAAYGLVEPFYDPEKGWGGHSLEHLAYRTLREYYPSLSMDDVHALVVATHRVYIQRHPAKSTHLSRPTHIKPPVEA